MAEPASTLAAGSVGTVETRYLDLPEPVRLDCGRELHPIRVAYETYGALSPRRDNVILVCHALSGDAHAAGFAKTPPEESTRDGFAAEDRDGTAVKGLGWWDGMIGPGKAFDTGRFFVVCTNLLGGCRGTGRGAPGWHGLRAGGVGPQGGGGGAVLVDLHESNMYCVEGVHLLCD